MLRGFCNETNLSITSTQGNLCLMSSSSNGLSELSSVLTTVCRAVSVSQSVSQSILNVGERGAIIWLLLSLIDVATGHGTNRFHQYNCRDVRSQARLHFTIKSALEIEKVQMWVWKLMDPYHKTNTKVTRVSLKCYEIIPDLGTNIVSSLSENCSICYNRKRWNFVKIRILENLQQRNQRLSLNKGASHCRTPEGFTQISIQTTFVLFCFVLTQ